MSNFYTVTKEIKGQKIVCQFNGISAGLKALDDCNIDGTNNTSLEKLYNYLFENVIVDPKMSLKDFGADKIGSEETKTINGKEYTAKFNGMLSAVKMIDDSYGENGNISIDKLSKYLFEKNIVKPEKLVADDFETMKDFGAVVSFAREVAQGGELWEELSEITTFARDVMQGNFREEKDTKPTKKASKE